MPALGRVWTAAAALCFGTLIGTAVDHRGLSLVLLVCSAAGLSVRRRPWVSLVALATLGIGAGMLNAQVRLAPESVLSALARAVPRCEGRGTVLEPVGNLALLVHLKVVECDGWSARDLGVVAVRDGSAAPGSRFHALGWMVPLGDEGFDLSLRRAGAGASLHTNELDVVSPPSGAHAIAERVRAGLSDAVSALGPRVGALIRGLTIGDTSGLDAGTIDRFRGAGLSHVLAVSGSNVAIVLGAVLAATRLAGHRAKVVCGYIGLALFGLVVGPDPSVLRAVAMGSIALTCLAWGRTSEPLAALGLSVIGVIALRPGMLFSVGMQLSVAATAGIVLFSARISEALPRMPVALNTMLAATLAAQIAVAPVLVIVFEELSVIAPLANALALPAVAPSTILGLSAAAVGIFAPWIGRLMARGLAPLGAWILAVADRTGAWSWSTIGVPRQVGWALAAGILWWTFRSLRQGIEAGR